MLAGFDRVSRESKGESPCAFARLGSANITDESEFTSATRSSVKGCARKLPLSWLREETSSPLRSQSRKRIERRGRSCHSLGSAYYGTSHHEKRSKVALRAAVITFTVSGHGMAHVVTLTAIRKTFRKTSSRMIHRIASRLRRASAIILWCISRRSFLGKKKNNPICRLSFCTLQIF